MNMTVSVTVTATVTMNTVTVTIAGEREGLKCVYYTSLVSFKIVHAFQERGKNVKKLRLRTHSFEARIRFIVSVRYACLYTYMLINMSICTYK